MTSHHLAAIGLATALLSLAGCSLSTWAHRTGRYRLGLAALAAASWLCGISNTITLILLCA